MSTAIEVPVQPRHGEVERLRRRNQVLKGRFVAAEVEAEWRAGWLRRLDDVDGLLGESFPDLRSIRRALDAIEALLPGAAPEAASAGRPSAPAPPRAADPEPVAMAAPVPLEAPVTVEAGEPAELEARPSWWRRTGARLRGILRRG